MLKFNLNRYIMRSGRMLTAYEKKYAKKLHQALKEQRKHCIENNFEIIDTLTPVITDLYNEVGEKMYLYQYRLLENTVTKSIFLNTFKVWLKIYIDTVALERVKMINDTTRFRAKQIIEEGFQSRLLFESIVDTLDATGIFGAGRAMTIVRTEIGNINNEAKDRSSEEWKKETGVDLYKIWIHRGAKNPRDWHVAMDNGKAIPKMQKYTVSNPNGETDYMDRPHDSTASAGNTINCGCEVIYVSESYAKRRGLTDIKADNKKTDKEEKIVVSESEFNDIVKDAEKNGHDVLYRGDIVDKGLVLSDEKTDYIFNGKVKNQAGFNFLTDKKAYAEEYATNAMNETIRSMAINPNVTAITINKNAKLLDFRKLSAKAAAELELELNKIRIGYLDDYRKGIMEDILSMDEKKLIKKYRWISSDGKTISVRQIMNHPQTYSDFEMGKSFRKYLENNNYDGYVFQEYKMGAEYGIINKDILKIIARYFIKNN